MGRPQAGETCSGLLAWDNRATRRRPPGASNNDKTRPHEEAAGDHRPGRTDTKQER
jgi:hypothetical protein